MLVYRSKFRNPRCLCLGCSYSNKPPTDPHVLEVLRSLSNKHQDKTVQRRTAEEEMMEVLRLSSSTVIPKVFLSQHIIGGSWSPVSGLHSQPVSQRTLLYCNWPAMRHHETSAVILECMQRNQELLQAYWNLKNYSQGGCGWAGFLHNCWCWVVRLAVVVVRRGGGRTPLCQQSAIEAFSNTHWSWVSECSAVTKTFLFEKEPPTNIKGLHMLSVKGRLDDLSTRRGGKFVIKNTLF